MAFRHTRIAGFVPLGGLLLGGCPWIGSDLKHDRFDVDGDGVAWPDDCDEGDATVYPGATETCDGRDEDCDGLPGADEADEDADGVRLCEADCDDADAARAPGKAEVCGNGVDEDCVGDAAACRWAAGPGLAPVASYTEAVSAFGYSLAAGDFDGDGDTDLVVGSPEGDGTAGRGGAWLYPGPLDAGDGSFAVLRGTADDENAGFTLANGGGSEAFDFVVAGAPGVHNEVSVTVGAIEVAFGEQVGDGVFVPRLLGLSRIGYTLASLDAHDAPGFHALFAIDGTNGVFFDLGGSTVTTVALPGCVAEFYGVGGSNNVRSAGDVDGDGVRDLAIGSPACGAVVDAGMAYVVDGAAVTEGAALDAIVHTRINGEVGGGLLGYAVAGGGDLDGDGYDDVVASVPLGRTFVIDVVPYEGSEAWVVSGRSSFPADLGRGDAHGVLAGPDVDEEYFLALDVEGDLDGDGHADLVVGVPTSDAGGADAGQVVAFYGPVAGDVAWASGSAFVGGEGQGVGWTLTSLGDLDGDGTDDVAVAGFGFSTTGAGGAHVLLGRGQ